MGKKIGKRSRGSSSGTSGGGAETDACWSSTDHAIRKAKQRQKLSVEKLEARERRSALLTRDSKEKHEEGKLRLYIKRVQRQIDKLRERLEAWDDVEEKRLAKERLQEEERKRKEEEEGPKKKKGRLGPETWKLKGAARPAWMVYEFDTRYVDPHMKAHEEARMKVARSRNILELCKGKFGNENDKDVPQPQCREYLSLLMQLGNLCMQSKQLKTARKAFLECLELDSIDHPVTPARCQLMRLYMEANRPDSARRLWERLSPNDPSVWIRFSAALVEYVSWKILEEEGSTQESAELLLAKAIKNNVFCAYYLAFFDVFDEVMDYAEEVEDAHESSPLEEAIEYCNSEQLGAWKGTDGALDWVKTNVLRVLSGESIGESVDKLYISDMDWRAQLSKIREKLAVADNYHEPPEPEGDGDAGADDSDRSDVDDDDSVVDLAMFATMFETAMEMLEVSGKLK